jgi:hypothetical protein
MILETILWYWKPFYDTGGYFTPVISRFLHSEMAIYLTCGGGIDVVAVCLGH